MTKDEIEKIETLLKKDPTLGRRRLSALTGVSVNRMQAYLTARKNGRKLPPVQVSGSMINAPLKVVGPSIRRGIPVKEFLAKLDYPAILAKAIRVHCKDDFLQESDMRAVSGLNPNNFRQAVNSGQFTENTLKLDGIVWWGTAANVEEAKKTKGVV